MPKLGGEIPTELQSCVSEVALVYDIVTIKHRPGFMAGDVQPEPRTPTIPLFFYLFYGMNLPPVSADLGVVLGDAFYSDGLADSRDIAGKFGYALRDDATG